MDQFCPIVKFVPFFNEIRKKNLDSRSTRLKILFRVMNIHVALNRVFSWDQVFQRWIIKNYRPLKKNFFSLKVEFVRKNFAL